MIHFITSKNPSNPQQPIQQPYVKRTNELPFSYGFPMVFPWFSYGFPIKTSIFLWFSYGFPMVFPTFESRPSVPRCYHLQVPPHSRLLGGLVGSGGPHLCPSPFFDFFLGGGIWVNRPFLGTGIYIYI